MEDDVRKSSTDRYAVSQAYRWRAERDQARQELERGAQDAENRLVELCAALDVDPGTGWSDAMECMRRRLMPEGYEWPRFEDGEPVRIGDKAIRYEEDFEVRHIATYSDGSFLLNFWSYASGERVKRPAPKVLTADGEPLEVGQTVYALNDDRPYTVKKVETNRVTVNAGEGAYDVWKAPTYLAHHRPVLDADGVPIELGDDLYSVEGGLKLHVSNIDRVSCMIATSAMFALDKWADPSMFTHTKPEPDNWERIEEDAEKDPCSYFGFDGEETCGKCPASGKNCEQTMALDIVRRAKALAERERGE